MSGRYDPVHVVRRVVRPPERVVVPASSQKWYHSNVHDASSACGHCGGIIRHERWCSAVNAAVRYAYEIAFKSEYLTREDDLRLHALGVRWSPRL